MSNKWVKRISRALLPCFVFFVFSFFFAPKAYAADANLDLSYGFFGERWYMSTNKLAASGYVASAHGTTPLANVQVNFNYEQRYIGDVYFSTDSTTEFSGPVKLYASYYYQGNGGVGILEKKGNVNALSTWDVSYTNNFGNTAYVEGGLDSFQIMPTSSSINGEVYAIEASWSGSEAYPVRELVVKRSSLDNGFDIKCTRGVNPSFWVLYPSVRIISSDYSAELEQLDKVADAIIAQNDILLAMKGDIVAILQDIYTMTGDMYVSQNLLNSYVAQLLPLIQDIDQTTTDIYSLLSSQLRLLETAIENAADSIEAAISAQTAAMIAYLEQYFNTGNEVPDDTYQQQQDAENILDQMGSLEKPDVNTVVPEIGDYTDGGVSGVLGAIFSSNLIVTMMTLSASFAFGAYVLFGKRD